MAGKLPPWLRELGESIQVDNSVLEAMDLPRERFVDSSFNADTLAAQALPIGNGQTISKPSTVARMTDALMKCRPKKVLEIGTGSGYQTAVLCRLVDMVYTVERLRNIQLDSIRRLYRLEIYNFKALCADGTLGWKTNAPYDAIMVTAAAQTVPPALFEQLSPGGLLIMPVGEQHQELCVFNKSESGEITRRSLGSVNFVPLIAGVSD
jgi:protein-L-isoaspartate(D-aspartate) O-methyltransferase